MRLAPDVGRLFSSVRVGGGAHEQRASARASARECGWLPACDVGSAATGQRARGMNARFRPMSAADLAMIRPIEDASYSHPWSEGNFADSLKAGYSAWLLEEGDACLGYYVVMQVVDELHVLNLAVAPAQRRRGLGRRLLEHALAGARERGAVRALLEVRVSNAPAIALYRAEGFTDLAVRHAYYPADGGREDALIMEKDLS